MSRATKVPETSPRKTRVSPVRLMLVVLACVGVGLASWQVGLRAKELLATVEPVAFRPHVDLTLTPTTHFEDPSVNPGAMVVLAFVVADAADPCLPTWGTHYTLDAAGRALDLDRRIARYREGGGEVVVSFGGQANDELAVVCKDPARLAAAYTEVIERYDVTVIDFDIEGDALLDVEANTRRAGVIAQVQKETGVEVWFTLPVAGHGLLDTGLAVIDQTLVGGVDLGTVNLMTMNFGGSRRSDATMGEAASEALVAAVPQIHSAFARAGIALTEEEAWQRTAATVMLGQNDVPADRFEVSDATFIRAFAAQRGLAFVGMWSMNRDAPCGTGNEVAPLSNTCSGVRQSVGQFADVFLDDAPVNQPAPPSTLVEVVITNDQSLGPYPAWRPTRPYEQGSKAVWQGRVYEAKWWTENDAPDAPVENDWETPWRYLGPLTQEDLDRAAEEAIADDGTWLQWRSESVYNAGDELQHEDRLYRASWWTQGDEPDYDPDQPYDHPWEYLGRFVPADQVKDALAESDEDSVFIEADR